MLRNASVVRTLCVGVVSVLLACSGDQGPTGGDGPAGANAVTKTSNEPPGANCPNGGVKIEAGIDANNNGQLDPAEINAASTAYVCNGTGTNALVKTSAEAAGANCPFGGTRIETGLDANNNGELDDTEVDAAATSYVCNFGPSGTIDPSTGLNVTVKTVATSGAKIGRASCRERV